MKKLALNSAKKISTSPLFFSAFRSLSAVKPYSTAIIGFTPASLCAGTALLKSGIKKVTIVDQKPSINSCLQQMHYEGKSFNFFPDYFGSSVLKTMDSIGTSDAFIPAHHRISFYNNTVNFPLKFNSACNYNKQDCQSLMWRTSPEKEREFKTNLSILKEYMSNINILNMLRIILGYSPDETLKTTHKYEQPFTKTTTSSLYETLIDEFTYYGGTFKLNTQYLKHFSDKKNKKQVLLLNLDINKKFNENFNQVINFAPSLNSGAHLPSSFLSTSVLFMTINREGMEYFKNNQITAFLPENPNAFSCQMLNKQCPKKLNFGFRLENPTFLSPHAAKDHHVVAYIHVPVTLSNMDNQEKNEIENNVISRIDHSFKNFKNTIKTTKFYSPSKLKKKFGINGDIHEMILKNNFPRIEYTCATDKHDMKNIPSTDSQTLTDSMSVALGISDKILAAKTIEESNKRLFGLK